jgi:hypothetical protein
MRGGYHPTGAEDDRLPRWQLPVPEPQRQLQPFIWTGRHLLAPWPRPNGLLPLTDQLRLEAMLAQFDRQALPDRGVCWCWPDREPVALIVPDSSWILAQMRDRTAYAIITEP